MLQLSREELLKCYRGMRTIREFEDRVHEEFATGKIPGFVHLYAGEEASAVGVCMHLEDKDCIGSTHRGHGHCIAKGVRVKAMMAELFGRRTGVCKGKGGSMHIADLDAGFAWLEEIADVPAGPGLTLLLSPWLDPYRDDPRFEGILSQYEAFVAEGSRKAAAMRPWLP